MTERTNNKFQVGETYAGRLPDYRIVNGVVTHDGIITVTKITKCYVFYIMGGFEQQTKRRSDGKTEYIKDEYGTFVKAVDKIKESAPDEPRVIPANDDDELIDLPDEEAKILDSLQRGRKECWRIAERAFNMGDFDTFDNEGERYRIIAKGERELKRRWIA